MITSSGKIFRSNNYDTLRGTSRKIHVVKVAPDL